MRNLKRALSLALASVMLLGMMVVGTSAASYADVESTDNVEAIEVLQAIGVMVGDDNGNFAPDAMVTREQMAVIMCNLLDYTVSTYKGTTKFTDVSTWALPYVEACYTNGIIAGYSETQFGGNDSVTTSQAALMILKALGYFQERGDFGNDWVVSTIRVGAQAALFDGVDNGATEALTRNDVAQIVLNALKAECVMIGSHDLVADGMGGFTTKAVYVARTGTGAKYDAIDRADNGSKNIINLGEELYNGALTQISTPDAFGRPATQWSYKVDTIGTYADEPVASYTAKVSKGELWSLIGKSNVDKLSDTGTTVDGKTFNKLEVYADGRPVTTPSVANYFANNSSAAAGSNTISDKAGKGVLTEVYQDNNNNVTIVYVNTYVLQANGDYNESKGTLAVSNVTYPGAVTTLYDEDFDLSGIQDEDYILVTASTSNGSTYRVESVAKAEVVTGTVDAYSQTNSVTIDGTKYDYAEKIEATDSKPMEYTVGAPAAVVLDEYGYVLYVDDAALSVGQYLYVNDVISSTGFSKKYQADAYFSDGTNEVINIDTLYTWDGSKYVKETAYSGITSSSTSSSDALNGWYSFSTNSDGEYTLKAIKAVSGNSSNGIIFGANKKVIEGEKTSFLWKMDNSAKNTAVYGNSDTIFVVVDEDDDVTVYTGIENAPDIKVNSTGSVKVAFMYSKDTAGKPASIVFVDASNGIIDDQTTEDFMYVLNRDTTYVDKANGETIYTWNVILNGEVTKVDAKANSALEPYTLYEKIKVDGDGYYDATKFSSSSKVGTTYAETTISSGTNEFTYSGNVLNLGTAGTFIVTENTQITLVLKDVTASTSDMGGTLASDAGMNQIMNDPDTKHEVLLGTTGQYLDRLLKDRDVKEAVVSSVIEETGSQVAETLYIVISSVESL